MPVNNAFHPFSAAPNLALRLKIWDFRRLLFLCLLIRVISNDAACGRFELTFREQVVLHPSFLIVPLDHPRVAKLVILGYLAEMAYSRERTVQAGRREGTRKRERKTCEAFMSSEFLGRRQVRTVSLLMRHANGTHACATRPIRGACYTMESVSDSHDFPQVG